MAGVVVAWLDVLPEQRLDGAFSPPAKTANMPRLSWRDASDRDHRQPRAMALAQSGHFTWTAGRTFAGTHRGVPTEMTNLGYSIGPLRSDVTWRHDGEPARVDPKSPIRSGDACKESNESPPATSSTSRVLISNTPLSDQLCLSNPTTRREQRKQNPRCLPVASGLLEQRI